MPELPEVETIRLGLIKKIVNKKITNVWIEPSFNKKILPNAKDFILFLKGKKIRNIQRKAKLLIFEINDDNFVLIHLKMTGQLIYQFKNKTISGGHVILNQDNLPNKFSRVIFYFADHSKLFFNDIRKFGYLKLVSKFDFELAKAKYGREPLDKEYTFEYFLEVLKKRPKQKIKVVLLDQKLISGLGNIYVDEVCFVSKVKPQRVVKTLKLQEKKLLFVNIRKIIKKAILMQGTTFSNYVNSDGQSGSFQKMLKVYGRVGEKCKKCKSEIVKTKIAGRTSSYCENCQK